MNRWLVEGSPDVFDDVGATSLAVEGGCLIFRDEAGKITLAYAAGMWRTVTETAD